MANSIDRTGRSGEERNQDHVRDAYNANAERYASLFLDELDGDAQSVRWLSAFAELASCQDGPVVDLGCGPGSVVNHLVGLGLTAKGLDLSPAQVAQACKAFPDLDFEVGDLTELEFAATSIGGIVARYSVIHMSPADLDGVFEQWMRTLQPGAPVFLSFFGSKSAEAHGRRFDHAVFTAHELFPATVERQLQNVGFVDIEVEATPIPEGGRPFDHATVLARKPENWAE